MSDLTDIIRKSWEKYPGNSAETISIDVLNELQVPAKASVLLSPLLIQYITTMERAETRKVERTAFNRRSDLDPVDVIAARKSLCDRGFFVNGSWVSWAKATIAQHQERISYLETKIAGMEETIEVHREAIDEIKRHNASCLAEIEDVA